MEMSYRPLGRCGTKVSVFGLGGWTTFGGTVKEQARVDRLLHLAFERGVNFFDTADIYAKGASEEAMGRALASLPRHRLVLATKLFWPMSSDPNDRGLSRKHIFESVEKSLRRLGTDYLDLYFCHRFDSETPLLETVRAMDDLVRQGKVLYWGTSEWSGERLREAHRLAREWRAHPPQVEQPQHSLLARGRFEWDVLHACLELGMGTVLWSPLASGLLSGKYEEGIPAGSRLDNPGMEWLRRTLLKEENRERVRRFGELARGAGLDRAQLALAWAADRFGVSSVILGATNEEQLLANLGALELRLDENLRAALEEIFPAGLQATD
jgi:voltage-dependent potassium channel beta subunit